MLECDEYNSPMTFKKTAILEPITPLQNPTIIFQDTLIH